MAKNKKTNVPLLLGVCAIVLSVALLGILAATGVLPIETTIDGVHTGIASGLRHFFACFVYDPGLIGDGGPIWWAETMSVGGTLGMFATIVEFFLLIAGIVVLVKNGNKGKIWSAVTLLIALFATNAIGSIFLNGMVYEVLWRSASFWYGLSLLILVLGAAALVYDLWPAIFADAEEDEEDEDMIPVFDEYACRKIVQEQIQKLRDAAPSVVTKEKADEIVERAIEEHVAKLHAEPSEEIQAEDPKASPFDGFGDTKRVPFVEKLEAADEDLKNKYQEPPRLRPLLWNQEPHLDSGRYLRCAPRALRLLDRCGQTHQSLLRPQSGRLRRDEDPGRDGDDQEVRRFAVLLEDPFRFEPAPRLQIG